MIVENARNVIMDQTLVDVGTTTKGVQFNNTDVKVKPLNNIKSDGTLLQAYNTSTSTSTPELATILQDADISLFKR